MRPPRGSCLRPSTANALQCVANLLGGERRDLGVGNRDDPFAPLLQPHRRRGNLDLEASIACPDFQWLTRLEPERLTQGFGNNDSTGRINGSSHGYNGAIKMAMLQPSGVGASSVAGRLPPAVSGRWDDAKVPLG
jgi:hypothetical protein